MSFRTNADECKSLSDSQFEQKIQGYGAIAPLSINGRVQMGTYGTMYGTQSKHLVVKYTSQTDSPYDELTSSDIKRELELLSRIRRIGICHVIIQTDFFFVEKMKYASVQKNGGLSLSEIYLNDPKVKEATITDVQKIGVQLFEALAGLHKHKIHHADIKPANIVLDQFGYLNVIDFNISRLINAESVVDEEALFVPNYSPPETLTRNEISLKGDVWAAGCVLFTLLNNALLFKGKNKDEVLNAIYIRLGLKQLDKSSTHGPRRHLQTLMNDLIKNAKQEDLGKFQQFNDLIFKLLEPTLEKRISAEEALNHPFFEREKDLCLKIHNDEMTKIEIKDKDGLLIVDDILPEGSFCYHLPEHQWPLDLELFPLDKNLSEEVI